MCVSSSLSQLFFSSLRITWWGISKRRHGCFRMGNNRGPYPCHRHARATSLEACLHRNQLPATDRPRQPIKQPPVDFSNHGQKFPAFRPTTAAAGNPSRTVKFPARQARRPPFRNTHLERASLHRFTMSVSCRYAAQCCARQLRTSSSTATPLRASSSLLQQQQQRVTRRYNSTDAAAAPINPKISAIVDQISQLTLLETADLVSNLKVRIYHHAGVGFEGLG